MSKVCAPRQKKRDEEAERKRFEELRRNEDRALAYWIPELYLHSDRAKVNAKNPKILALIDNFVLDGDKGLFLTGKNGMCKTRGGCILLERYCRRRVRHCHGPEYSIRAVGRLAVQR